MRFRRGQVNVQQTDTAAVTAAHVDAQWDRFDVIVWNELGTIALQEQVRNRSGWTSYMPGVPKPGKVSGVNQVAISWRDDMFRQVAWDTTVVHRGLARITPVRVIHIVLLEHLPTGRLHYEQGTHVVHHIEVAGKPRLRGAITGQNARARKHFELLAADIARYSAEHPLVGSGDLNVDWFAEKRLPPGERCPWFPYTTLGKVAQVVVPDHGTHGGRLIDWAWTAGPGVRAVSCQALPRGSSDHNPVLTVVELS